MYQLDFENKDVLKKKMVSEKGKILNRNIMNFSNFITTIIVIY
jgi:ribosomal protein S18